MSISPNKYGSPAWLLGLPMQSTKSPICAPNVWSKFLTFMFPVPSSIIRGSCDTTIPYILILLAFELSSCMDDGLFSCSIIGLVRISLICAKCAMSLSATFCLFFVCFLFFVSVEYMCGNI